MPKEKIVFICSNCGYQTPRWQGKCAQCGEWNTLEQKKIVAPTAKSVAHQSSHYSAKVTSVAHIKNDAINRFSSGINEFDLVLGGGLVPGALVLLGGDPGIGKSTLALQSAVLLSKTKKVLYISGEESVQQVYLRANRITKDDKLLLLAETNLETILATLENEKPDLAVIDSVQTVSSAEVNGVVGGVSQIAYVTNSLMRLAKQYHITLLIIGHVTKEGMLAGPKTLEHMVDTVLYLEGERFQTLRMLRSNKNRFGSVGEVGVFDMTEQGLMEVLNPSLRFLEERTNGLSGSCLAPIVEGNKVLLVEVQALTTKTNFGYPRRTTSGFDLNRLQLICAILQKNLKVNLSDQDVYINIAGGFSVTERAADLAVAIAILSSLHDKAVTNNLVAFGELGLLGEVRAVSQSEKRLKELEKLGFTAVAVGGKVDAAQTAKYKKLTILNIRNIVEIPKSLRLTK